MGEQIAVVPAVRAWGASVVAGAAHLGGAVMAGRENWERKLRDVEIELGRQMEHIGVRLGVLRRVGELERKRAKIIKKLTEIQDKAVR